MDRSVRTTVMLTSEEVTEAVREYIELHSAGDVYPSDNLSVTVVLEAIEEDPDFTIKAEWTE